MADIPSTAWHALLSGDTMPVMLLIAMIAVVCIVSVIAVQWRRVRVAEADATIKARMIEKGYSADEIERVLHAESQRPRHRSSGNRCGVVSGERCT